MLDIAPRTDRGTGLILPLTKAIVHVMNVLSALIREHPMTVEEAAAELHEASEHLNDINYLRDLLTEDTNTAIDNWRDSLREAIATVQANSLSAPDATISEATIPLARIVRDTWPLLTLIDRELTGLSEAATDPGRNA